MEVQATSNNCSSSKPADDNSLQADVAQSDLAAVIAGKPTMEEISARLSAKLALMEASQQV